MGTDVFGYNNNTGNYELIDYIKSNEEINAETEAKIRERYSVSDELKLNRLANAVAKSQTPLEFVDYNNYVDECRAEGSAKKQAAAEARAALTEVELPAENEGEEAKIILVR